MDDTQNLQPETPKVEPQIAVPAAEPILASAETGHAEPGVHIRSKKWLFRVGLAVAILNPVFSGLLLGVFFLREPELKREGKIILTTAIAWGVFVLAVAFLRDRAY